jgi:selenocysteine lyase/cysteine desulfurase
MAGSPGGTIDVAAIRARFSSLRQGFAFLDAPGGSQVPDEVGDAIAAALRDASANLGAVYATSLRVKEIFERAEANAARFLGCQPDEVIFGANMTSLDFTLSRTAGRGFAPGDEILVSSADHDGGVAPWLELARDKDLVVRHVELNDDTTLDFGDLERKLGSRSPGRRMRSARSWTPAGRASSRMRPARWPGSTPSTMRRTSRSTCARSVPTC